MNTENMSADTNTIEPNVTLAAYSLEELLDEIERRDGVYVLDVVNGVIDDRGDVANDAYDSSASGDNDDAIQIEVSEDSGIEPSKLRKAVVCLVE